jgi:hypothetical protein
MDAPQDPPGTLGRPQSSRAARSEPTQQRLQTTDRLSAQSGEVVVAVRQQTQHRSVINRDDVPQSGVAQCDDRGCPGVVRVGLVGAAGVEQPDLGRRCRGGIEHGLAGGDQLLGQQRAEPGGCLDGSGAGLEVGRELEQPLPLALVGHDPKLVDDGLAAVEYRRGM